MIISIYHYAERPPGYFISLDRLLHLKMNICGFSPIPRGTLELLRTTGGEFDLLAQLYCKSFKDNPFENKIARQEHRTNVTSHRNVLSVDKSHTTGPEDPSQRAGNVPASSDRKARARTACIFCRKRRKRCVAVDDASCSNCLMYGLECVREVKSIASAR